MALVKFQGIRHDRFSRLVLDIWDARAGAHCDWVCSTRRLFRYGREYRISPRGLYQAIIDDDDILRVRFVADLPWR